MALQHRWKDGPVDQEELTNWIHEGRVQPSDLVWQEGMADWQPASSVEALKPLVAMPPAAPASLSNEPPRRPSSGARMSAGQHQLTPFSPGVAILLHYVTFGIFTMIFLNLMHGKMPKIRPDDPSAGKAIGFLFIPFFNLYWVFFTYCRLCIRINEQRASRRLPPKAPQGLAIAMCILMILPYIGILSSLILVPIFLGIVQSAVNELVEVPPTAA